MLEIITSYPVFVILAIFFYRLSYQKSRFDNTV